MSDLKKNIKNFSISIIPFIFLFAIGLIEGKITYHQKIFKTLMIFVFDITLAIVFFIFNFKSNLKTDKGKKKKYLIFFIAYFLFIFIQYVISYLSGEVSYDRNYYLANYTFLIVFSSFFFFFLNNIEQLKINLILLQLFIIVIFIWSINDYQLLYTVNNVKSIPSKIEQTSFENDVLSKLSTKNTQILLHYYRKQIKTNEEKDKNVYYLLDSQANDFIKNYLSHYSEPKAIQSMYKMNLAPTITGKEYIQNLYAITKLLKKTKYKKIFAKVPISSLRGIRPKLSFGNVNYFAGYLIGFLPLLFIIPILWFRKKRGNIIIFIVSIIISVAGLLPLMLTQTRAAQIGFFVGVFLFMIPLIVLSINRIKLPIKISITALLLVLFIVVPIRLLQHPPVIVKDSLGRMVDLFRNPRFRLGDRINGWEGGIGLFKKHPVLGAGLGTVYAASFKYIDKYYFIYSGSSSFKHSHNEYVEVLGEGGLFGIIFFIGLVGFIIGYLIKISLSKKYKFTYKIIGIAIASGIVSMMIHQIFSLTLRMSVTMSAFFALLGIGLFLISVRKKYLIFAEHKEGGNVSFIQKILPPNIKNIFSKLSFLQKQFLPKEYVILSAILFGITLVSFPLYAPVFFSENSFVKTLPMDNIFIHYKNNQMGINQQEFERKIELLNKAVKIKPNNPYAWTKKWSFDKRYAYQIASSKQGNMFLSQRYPNLALPKLFDTVKNDLDSINNIIPGYQDVWGKYFDLYFTEYNYYKQIHGKGHEEKSKQALLLALESLDRSLEKQFLYEKATHGMFNYNITKMTILQLLDNKLQFSETVAEYFKVRIYLDFCKAKQIIKEKVKISFTNDKISTVKIEKGVAHFIISNENVKKIVEKIYGKYGVQDRQQLNSDITNQIRIILNPLFNKAVVVKSAKI